MRLVKNFIRGKDLFNLLGNPSLVNFLIVFLAVNISLLIKFNSFKFFSPVLFSDNAIYAILTTRFISGDYQNALHIWWQPLYPFLGSLIFNLTKNVLESLFLVSVISGSLLFVPIYFITKELTKNLYFSLLAAFLSVFHPLLIRSYFSLLTENLFIFLEMVFIMFSLLTLTRKRWYFASLAGVSGGLAYLCRNDILLPLQLYLLMLILFTLFKKIEFKFTLKAITFCLISFIIIISPYLLFNYQRFSYLNLSAKINAAGNTPAYFSPQNNFTSTFAQDVWSIDTPNYDSHYFNVPLNYYKYRVIIYEAFLVKMASYIKLINTSTPQTILYLFFFGFFISLLYFAFKKPLFLALHVFLILGVLLSVPFHPGVDFRYLYWIFPILNIFLALAMFFITKFLVSFFKLFLKGSVTVSIVKFFFIVLINLALIVYLVNINKNTLTVPSEFTIFNQAPDQFKIVGSYIKSLSSSKPRVMTRREAFAYYADSITIYIPSSLEMQQLKDYAKLWKVNFIIADRFTFAPDTPLGILVYEEMAPDWLKVVKIWNFGFTKTILYKVEL